MVSQVDVCVHKRQRCLDFLKKTLKLSAQKSVKNEKKAASQNFIFWGAFFNIQKSKVFDKNSF